MSITDNQLRDALVNIAEEFFGPDHESTSAQLFALLCNAVKVVANEYHNENPDNEARSIAEVPEHEMAEVLGPVVANMCENYVIVADAHYVAS